MKLDPDFREFIECCIARDVRFLIVGGYALIDATSLTINKLASGRPQDIADAKALGES